MAGSPAAVSCEIMYVAKQCVSAQLAAWRSQQLSIFEKRIVISAISVAVYGNIISCGKCLAQPQQSVIGNGGISIISISWYQYLAKILCNGSWLAMAYQYRKHQWLSAGKNINDINNQPGQLANGKYQQPINVWLYQWPRQQSANTA